MKAKNQTINRYRIREGPFASDNSYGNNGYFHIPGPDRQVFHVIASDEMGWDHVSVSLAGEKRCPTWNEMSWIKELFWEPSECVIQYHPPDSEYVNLHPFVLHLWKPRERPIPMPPLSMV